MRRFLPLLIVPIVCIAVRAQAAQSVRCAVFSLGTDPVAAGGIQLTVEARLREQPDTGVVSASEIARRFAIPDVIRPADPDRDRRKRLLDAGSAAYYQGDYDAAAKQLTTLSPLMDGATVPIDERIRFYLWEASVAVARNQNEAAETSALKALVLRPDLAVDLETFRPSLATLVDVLRDAGLEKVSATLVVEPGNAKVFLDEKPVDAGTLTLVKGTHWLTVSAPGFRTVSRVFEVTPGARTTVTLPIALQAGPTQLLGALMNGRRLTEKQVSGLEDIAAQLDVDALVVISSRRNPDLQQKAVIWYWGDEKLLASPVFMRGNGGPMALIGWISKATQGDTGTSGGGASQPITFDLSVAEGVFAARRYYLQSPTGGGTDVTFPGFGPRVRAVVGWRWLYLELTGQYITYTVIKPAIRFPDGSSRLINGGASTLVRGSLGAEFWVSRFALGGFASYLYEDHQEGSDIELFPGYFRTAVEVGGSGGMELGPVVVRVRGGLIPFSQWQEVPRGTTGQSPSPGLGFKWGVSVVWAPSARWNVVGGYEGELRSVRFTGPSALAFDPAIEDALLQEQSHTASASLRFLF